MPKERQRVPLPTEGTAYRSPGQAAKRGDQHVVWRVATDAGQLVVASVIIGVGLAIAPLLMM